MKEILLLSETSVRPCAVRWWCQAAYQVGLFARCVKGVAQLSTANSHRGISGAINATYLAAFEGSWRTASKHWWAFGNRCEPKRYTAPDSAP